MEEIVVTKEFEDAFRVIEGNAPFVFITGKAGTGKTTFIGILRERLRSYAIVAPTGVAALNVGGQTIHSFFRIAPGPIDFAKIRRVSNRTAYQALQTLIIDEISMVRADLLDAMDLMLRKNGRDPEKPFGGVQVIAVGDLFQLPPVVSTKEEQAFLERGYQSHFFFGARSIGEMKITTVEFSHIFRQTQEPFLALLNSLREGKNLEVTLEALNSRIVPLKTKLEDGVVLTSTNDRASTINSTRLSDIPSQVKTYTGEVTGEIRVDKEKLPAPIELTLKVGAQVMFVKNDGSKRWVNGSLGTVAELGADYVVVNRKDKWGSGNVRVVAETWKNYKYAYNADKNEVVATEVGSYKQIPLTLAWAVTIHKSQGKTFDRVHIDLGRGAFAEGQVYVALSRCRMLEGVTLEKAIKKSDICLNLDVIEFCSGI